MIAPVITKEQAESFSKVWNYHGIEVPLDNVHFEFAANFCTVVLRSFIEQILQKPIPKPPEPPALKIIEG